MSELSIHSVSGLGVDAGWGKGKNNHIVGDAREERVAQYDGVKPALAKPASYRRINAQAAVTLAKARSDIAPGLDIACRQRAMLRDITRMDPMLLSMLVAFQTLDVSASNANALSQQLTRATDLQVFLRAKQVEQYQEQINKAVEQADLARRAAFINVMFDWVVCAIEAGYGGFKILEGLASANPLELADGAAFIMAAATGMVKVYAELLLASGMDETRCNAVIRAAGTAHTVCEGVAMTLDVIQVGQKILCATRAVVPAVEKELAASVGEELVGAVTSGSESEISRLADQLAQEMSQNLCDNMSMAMERGTVDAIEIGMEAAEMVGESVEQTLIGEESMVRRMGRRFTREGVANMIKMSIESGAKTLLEQGEPVCAEKLRGAILKALRRTLIQAVRNDACLALMLMGPVVRGTACISAGIVGLKAAELRKEIEILIIQQRFNDFIDNWTEDRKKIQQQQLGDYIQQGSDVLARTTEMMDDSGTVLARVVAGCA